MPTKAEIRLIVNEHFIDVNIRKVKDNEEFFYVEDDIEYCSASKSSVSLKIFDKYFTGGPITEEFDKYGSLLGPDRANILQLLEKSSFREIDPSVYISPGEDTNVRYFQKFLLVPDHLVKEVILPTF